MSIECDFRYDFELIWQLLVSLTLIRPSLCQTDRTTSSASYLSVFYLFSKPAINSPHLHDGRRDFLPQVAFAALDVLASAHGAPLAMIA